MDAASAYFATPGGDGFPEANRPADTTVKDIMTEAPIVWVDSNASCAYAASLMLEKNVGLLPVKDPATDALLGVLTDRDLIVRVVARALDAAATPVGAVMSGQSVALVYEDADLVAAERLMIDRGVRRLPVTRRADNEVVGIISVDDFAMAGFRRRAGEIIRGSLPGVAPIRGLDVPAAVGEATAPSAEAPYVTPSVYTVADVMTGLPELVRETQTCREAAARMEARSVGFLVVCSDGAPARVRGVVTDRDLVVRVLAFNRKPEAVLVGDAMSLDVVACHADSNLADAESLMIERGVRRLPVLRRETGELVGVVSVDDLAVAASRSRAGRVLESVAQAPTLDGGAADETALKAECASLHPPPAVGAGAGGAGAGAGADTATGTA